MEQEITLTPSQEIACQKIDKFLKSKQRVFRLIGPAGYGKTTVLKTALKEYLNYDKSRFKDGRKMIDSFNYGFMGEIKQIVLPNVVGVTLSHQARIVLTDSIYYCATFAKAYGYKENILSNGYREFKPQTHAITTPIGHLPVKVLVFDESSMISNKMLNIVMNETPMSTKIIFVGDNAQLPPVQDKQHTDKLTKDKDSPVFTLDLSEEFHHELKEPVRQELGNPILELGLELRKEIFGQHNVGRIIDLIFSYKLLDNGNGIEVLTKNEAISKYIDEKDFLKSKFVTYRNSKVKNLNTEIRNILKNNPLNELVKDDIIILTNNFFNKDPDFNLYNAEQFVIDNVIIDTFSVCDYNIECYCAYLKDVEQNNHKVFVLHPTERGMVAYNVALMNYKDRATGNRRYWKDYYSFIDSFTQFTMGYALNAYRSQGSTYNNIFFDILDVLELLEWNLLTPKQALQTIYTAITRAKKRVTFIKPNLSYENDSA